MFKFFKKKTTKHAHNLATVKVYDKIWDRVMDNDDMEDDPTICIVTYCKSCGRITDVVHSNVSRDSVSCLGEIREFESITGISADSVTLWKEPKPLKKFSECYSW